MTDEPVLRVVVVDDHELVRAGLRGVLDGDPGIEVVAEASDGTQGLAAIEVHHPDVVVMDLQMAGMGGIEATRRIQTVRPGTAVLVLTMFDDDESVFTAIRAGARGYLLKGAGRVELRSAVHGVAAGQAVFGPGVAARVLGTMAGNGGAAVRSDALPDLTPRERSVLELLVEGLAVEAIAARIGVAEKTVRNNVSSILTKLQVADRAAAVEAARQAGMGRPKPDADRRVLVFTDILGSSALVKALGDELYASVLSRHNELVDVAVEAHGGTVFGSAGDARFAWFADGTDAIAAVLAARDALAGAALPAGVAVEIRAGIHAGPVVEHKGELVGVTLHEAARVAAYADGAQVLLTEAARPAEFPTGVRVTDLGERELRDVDRPLRLYEVERAPW